MASYKNTERERLAFLIELHNREDNQTYGATWNQLRLAILERDNYICQYCRRKANTVHHTAYGEITEADLISACLECHIKRHGLDPELISRQTREIHDLEEAIEFVPKKIGELKSQLEGYDNHWLMPYMMSRQEWEKYQRPYLVNQIEEMVNGLSNLKLEYETAKAKRR